MYKVIPIDPNNTNPVMLQDMLNNFSEDGFELIQILNYRERIKLLIISDKEKRVRETSFGVEPMND